MSLIPIFFMIAVLVIVMVILVGHHFVVLIAHVFHPHVFGAFLVVGVFVILALFGFALVTHKEHLVAANSAIQNNEPQLPPGYMQNVPAVQVSAEPGWIKLAFVALLGGLVVAALIALFGHGRIHLLAHLNGGGIALLGLLAVAAIGLFLLRIKA